MADIRDLMQQRAKAVADARALIDRADAEKRDLSGEEQQQYDRAMKEERRLADRIKEEEKLQALERTLAQSAGVAARPDPALDTDAGNTDPRNSKAYREAYGRFLVSGRTALTAGDIKALEATRQPDGGYLTAPTEFVRQLIKKVDDLVFIRSLATVHTLTTSDSLGAPALDNDPDDADWTAELGTGSDDTGMKFGKRELKTNPLAKRIKVSRKLLRSSVLDVEGIVRDRLAYKYAITHEKAYMTGDGVENPLGIFTNSNQGISSARDVANGNSTTALAFDGLINAKYALKAQYWKSARWAFHRDAVAQLAKLKDTTNQYLWQPSTQAGQPDLLLGFPVMMSEFVPNTFTTGKYVGALADFSHYWIADALDMSIQRLDELYAEKNQVGFIGRFESDGMPTLEEAFVRVTLS